MAVVTGTVQAVELVRGPDDAYGAEVATATLYSASLSIWNDTASTVDSAVPDTLAVNAATAIQNSRRDGKTVTIRSAAVVGAAVVGGTSFGGVATFSSPTVSISPRTAAFGTPAVLPANTSATQRYFRVIVGYTVA
jgi:hypothetical protein